MMTSIEQFLFDASVWVIPVIMAITFHEAAHGYVARYFGDMTAYAQGRVSLNPLRHVDVNGRRVDIPSYQVRPGDEVRLHEDSKDLLPVQISLESKTRPVEPGQFLHLVGPKFVASAAMADDDGVGGDRGHLAAVVDAGDLTGHHVRLAQFTAQRHHGVARVREFVRTHPFVAFRPAETPAPAAIRRTARARS